MPDIETGLPIRSHKDGADERVLVKIQDADSPDAAGSGMEVREELASVRPHGVDSDGAKQEVLVSQEGHTQSNGDYDAATNKRPSSQGAILHDRKSTAESPAEADQNVRPTGVSYDNGVDETIVAADVAIRDEDGVPYSETNPLPTYMTEAPGEEIQEFHQTANLVKAASEDFDYTVTALKSFHLEQWKLVASGLGKGELQVETGVATGIFSTVDVMFNSVANPDEETSFKRPIIVAAGVKVRISFTNLENQAQFLYGFVNGIEK